MTKHKKKTFFSTDLFRRQFSLPHTRGSSHGHSRTLRVGYTVQQSYYSTMTEESVALWRQLEEEAQNQIFKYVLQLCQKQETFCSVFVQRYQCSTIVLSQTGVLYVALDPKNGEPAERSLQKCKVTFTKLTSSDLRSVPHDTSEGQLHSAPGTWRGCHLCGQGGKVLSGQLSLCGGVTVLFVQSCSLELQRVPCSAEKQDPHCLSLQKVFEQNGGVIHDCERVLNIVPGDPVMVRTSRGEYRCRRLVLTVGAWARDMLKPLGLSLPLQVNLAVLFVPCCQERFTMKCTIH